MSKTIYTMLITVWIITPIMMLNVANTKNLESDEFVRDPELVAISNWQVFSSCKDSIDEEEENREIAGYICRMMFDGVYEANQYHTLFTEYFEEQGRDRELELMNYYSMTGCDINEMKYVDMKYMYMDYIDNNEDELGKSFYRTMYSVLQPYCDEMKDASIDFHLDENDDRRRT